MPRSVRLMVALMLVVMLGLIFMVWQSNGQIQDNKSDINNLNTALTSSETKFNALVNRKWHDVHGTHSVGHKVIVNSRNYPIEVALTTKGKNNSCEAAILVDGQIIQNQRHTGAGGSIFCIGTVTIPPGSEYYVLIEEPGTSRGGELVSWFELY